jgi:diguanylate cyclase (GGDEF)-like protein
VTHRRTARPDTYPGYEFDVDQQTASEFCTIPGGDSKIAAGPGHVLPRGVAAAWSTTTKSEHIAVNWIRQWWRQPDQFDWLSAYLGARNLLRFTRFIVAAVVLLLGAAPLLMLLSPVGPTSTVGRLISIFAAAICGFMAVLWATQWPTRRQLLAFTAATALCIAAGCLVQSTPVAGLQGATAFAALAGYVAFFHTSRALLLTLAVAATTAMVCAAQIAAQLDPFAALSKLLILSVGVLAVPYSAHVLVHVLGVDALKSDVDPLTELPNRRGFYRSMRTLTAESIGSRAAELSAVMIDLDAFKRVNDTAGHAAGDQTLVAVADILRRTRRGDSVLGRMGGEEFVVGIVGPRHHATGLAERLRREIAAMPWNVTASVGVATVALRRIPPDGIRGLLQGLIESADRAMYTAKRSGGDRVHVSGTPADHYADAPAASAAPRRNTAAAGNLPWTVAARPFVGSQANGITAAASMEPAPGKIKAAPAAVPQEIVNPAATPATMAEKRL